MVGGMDFKKKTKQTLFLPCGAVDAVMGALRLVTWCFKELSLINSTNLV